MFWTTGNLAIDIWGEVSVILKIYIAPFIATISICCLLGSLAVIEGILRSLRKETE
jgi:hypothetical protein